MKRLFLILLILSLTWPSIVMGATATCSWEEGSDNLNTGASTEFVWDSEVDAVWDVDLATVFDGYTSLEFTGAPTGKNMNESLGNHTDHGYRAAFNVTAESFGSGSAITVARGISAGAADLYKIKFIDEDGAGSYGFRVTIWDSASAEQTVGSDITPVNLSTWYQVRLELHKNQAGSSGAKWELYDATGTQIGSTQNLDGGVTTKNTSMDRIQMYKEPYNAFTYYTDYLEVNYGSAGETWPAVYSSGGGGGGGTDDNLIRRRRMIIDKGKR